MCILRVKVRLFCQNSKHSECFVDKMLIVSIVSIVPIVPIFPIVSIVSIVSIATIASIVSIASKAAIVPAASKKSGPDIAVKPALVFRS